ncbi:TlpA family protein disulfide reductase [Pedobacter nyackensis]|uniref:Thiol-disulfide isomerase or thioredoxin n=1 Tax=Pedobacter nyackensis TaxID=475255 RepID=A0A1W2BCE4_9SPHI|nr:TlpA disulfide reductase family protein [Pedobacter nyackensis]SMC70579.1 Thiol-disulfide isomerase or thioredoxin [Pedobacter nyackensis]
MIKTGIITLTMFCSMGLAALAQKPVEIKGTLSSPLNKQVKLYSVLEGTLEEVTAVNVKEDGAFRFMFYPEYEGFYVLGTGTAMAPSHNNTFYFKGGDNLDLSLTDTTYVLQGKLNSKENQMISKWFEHSFKVKQKSVEWARHYTGSTFKDFFPDLEALSNSSKEFIAKHKSGNPKFDQVFPILVKWDLAAFGIGYIFTPRRIHPTPEEYTPAINYINAGNFTKSAKETFLYPFGLRTLKSLTLLETMKNKISISKSIVGLETNLKFVLSDTLKGDLVLDYLSHQKDQRNFSEAFNKYGKLIVTPRQKKVLAQYESKLSPFKPGDQAFAFSFPDVNDKHVSVNDLKGKVVVIDVWATWCGPCKQEIPHIEKLGEEFKGKDIAFVSISVDQLKDKEKWLQMIKDEHMGGIQLFAGSGNEFSKHYVINTIPRFFVFDKHGKLVTADAPRPSDPKLKLILEEELKKANSK